MRRAIAGSGAAVLIVLLAAACGGARPEKPVTPQPPLVFEDHTPARKPAGVFGAGSYFVGQDVALGRYSAGADAARACRWRQIDQDGQTLDADAVDRPTQVLTLNTAGSRLVVAGDDCRFTRLPG